MKLRIGHLYPDYLNIYADRGNIAVLSRRAAWRGHDLEVNTLTVGDAVRPGEHDLLYVGGGQDREQALVARDLAAKGDGVHDAVEAGVALLAVCGGYQLLGRSYRDLHGPLLPRNPWFADWLLAQAIAHVTGEEPTELSALADDLEADAHAVSARRAETRGGRFS